MKIIWCVCGDYVVYGKEIKRYSNNFRLTFTDADVSVRSMFSMITSLWFCNNSSKINMCIIIYIICCFNISSYYVVFLTMNFGIYPDI